MDHRKKLNITQENNMSTPAYLDENSLVELAAAGGKTLERVICHLWINNIVSSSPVELIDNIRLEFSDGEKLVIGTQEENVGLKTIDFDLGLAQKELKSEF